MHNTHNTDKQHAAQTIVGTDNSVRRNPVAAAHAQHAGTNAAGFHESAKYTRKTKHRLALE